MFILFISCPLPRLLPCTFYILYYFAIPLFNLPAAYFCSSLLTPLFQCSVLLSFNLVLRCPHANMFFLLIHNFPFFSSSSFPSFPLSSVPLLLFPHCMRTSCVSYLLVNTSFVSPCQRITSELVFLPVDSLGLSSFLRSCSPLSPLPSFPLFLLPLSCFAT